MYKRLCSLLAKADWSDNDVDMICSIVNKNPEFLKERLRDNFCGKCSMFRDRLTCKCEEVIIIPALIFLIFINRCAFHAEIRQRTYFYAGNRDVK